MKVIESKVVLPEIGEVKLRRKSSVKRLSIKIHPIDGVFVTMPYRMSPNDALKFVALKRDWVLKTLARVKTSRTVWEPDSIPPTKFHTFEWTATTTSQSISFRIYPTVTKVQYAPDIDFHSPEVQRLLSRCITETLRRDAQQYLPQRIQALADRFHLCFSGLTVKNIRSRWGSCSASNHINISLYVMQLPDELIDYILLHELAHTREKNHGRSFYQLLNEFTQGKHKTYQTELKRYRCSI